MGGEIDIFEPKVLTSKKRKKLSSQALRGFVILDYPPPLLIGFAQISQPVPIGGRVEEEAEGGERSGRRGRPHSTPRGYADQNQNWNLRIPDRNHSRAVES